MANTTNLNLAKPAGTDKALVSVLNSNSDKIDAWAGSTNQAISNIRQNEIVIPITADTDLNTLTTPGYYNLYGANSLVNAPTSGTNRLGLIVQRAESAQYVYQMAFDNVQNATGVFVRSCKGGTWTAWEQIAQKSDVTVTPYSGTTIVESSVKKNGSLVSGTVVFKMDASATTWKNAFQVSPAPKSGDTYAPCILTNNGNYLGMCKFYNNTAVQIYPLNAITASSQTVSVTFSYATD